MPPIAPLAPVPPTPPELRPICLTDHDADDRSIFALLLKKAQVGEPVQAHASGEELVASLSKLLRSVGLVVPLLCFLELSLPAMHGQDVLRWIREQPQLDAMSVVILSNSDHPADIQAAARGGAQCYLSKYPHPAVLNQVVTEAKRLTDQSVATEWFGLRANLLLRWGLASPVTAQASPAVTARPAATPPPRGVQPYPAPRLGEVRSG